MQIKELGYVTYLSTHGVVKWAVKRSSRSTTQAVAAEGVGTYGDANIVGEIGGRDGFI